MLTPDCCGVCQTAQRVAIEIQRNPAYYQSDYAPASFACNRDLAVRPTLNPVGNIHLVENWSLQTVNLSGITTGPTNEPER